MSEVEFEYEDDGDDYAEASSLVSAEPAVTQAQESQQLPDSDTVDAAALISKDIRSIVDLFAGVDEEDAWLMLAHFQFNRERLVDALLENVDATRRGACVTAAPSLSPPSCASATFFCGVMIEDVPYSDGFALPCGHWFSLAAWRSLVLACVSNGSTDDVVFGARCPEHGCGERIRRSVFAQLLPPLKSPEVLVSPASRGPGSAGAASPRADCCVASPPALRSAGTASVGGGGGGGATVPALAPAVAASSPSAAAGDVAAAAPPPLAPLVRYHQHCVRAYVACHPGIVSCKGPGCVAVLRRPPGAATLECPAGHRFCAARKCAAQEAHEPASCDEVVRWAAYAQSGAHAVWLRKNAKPCPVCRRWIERSTGCNKMHCPCGASFCFLCGRAPFESFHNYPAQAWDCNLPPASLYEGEDAERLAFYAAREIGAEELAVAAQALLPRLEAAHATMADLLGTTDAETVFLRDAGRVLVAARQALRWSWPHAFFRAQALARDLAAFRAIEAATAAGVSGGGGGRCYSGRDAVERSEDGSPPRKQCRIAPSGAPVFDDTTPHPVPPAAAESLESVAARHPPLRAPLRELRLFEARQGQLEGAAERLAGALDASRLEADVVAPLRAVSGAVRAAYVLGDVASALPAPQPLLPPPEGCAAPSPPVRRDLFSVAAVAEGVLTRQAGGLPALCRRVADCAFGATRSLHAFTAADEEDDGRAGGSVGGAVGRRRHRDQV